MSAWRVFSFVTVTAYLVVVGVLLLLAGDLPIPRRERPERHRT